MRLKTLRRLAGNGSRKWVLVGGLLGLAGASAAAAFPGLYSFLDATGVVSTSSASGAIDQKSPFFQSLGTNGRSCATCHITANAMGLSADFARARFEATRGHDPLFADVDGANCPGARPDDAAAHSLLLQAGLFRIALQLPAGTQFTIRAVRDPYGCAVVTDPDTGLQTISVYRRPLPAANLGFLSSVMSDGRETIQPLNNPQTFQANLLIDLMHQALDATTGHAQAAVPPTAAQQAAMADFEMSLTSAQSFDFQAGQLDAAGAQGGPTALTQQSYYPGMNDSLGGDPNGIPFNSTAFTLFASWENLKSHGGPWSDERIEARKQIAAGEALFNTRPLTISNVRGLTDNAALATSLGTSLPIPPFEGTCTTCHDTPNVGNHSMPLPLDIGTSHDLADERDPVIANALSQLNGPEVPVYEITGCPDPFAGAPQSSAPYVIFTTDPGKALISGLCSDVSRTKGPILRGLAARAPYFHNGAAQNLEQVVNFYNQRFQMNLSEGEKRQLIAFLNSL